MTKTVNVGYTDTPISGVTGLPFARGLVNFAADFRVKQNQPNEAVLSNLTSPIDRAEKYRFAYSDIKDVYANTDIDPSVYAPSRRGVKVLCQVTDVFSVTDSEDPEYRVDLPISAHVIFTVPASEYLTSAMVQTFLGRVVSGLYETGSLTTDRISALSRGSLIPADL